MKDLTPCLPCAVLRPEKTQSGKTVDDQLVKPFIFLLGVVYRILVTLSVTGIPTSIYIASVAIWNPSLEHIWAVALTALYLIVVRNAVGEFFWIKVCSAYQHRYRKPKSR
jgi:hypothetical protein